MVIAIMLSRACNGWWQCQRFPGSRETATHIRHTWVALGFKLRISCLQGRHSLPPSQPFAPSLLILEPLFNSTQRALRLLVIYTLHNITISMPKTSQNFHKYNHHTVGTVVLDVPGGKTSFLLDCEFKPIGVGSHSIREPSHYFSRSS